MTESKDDTLNIQPRANHTPATEPAEAARQRIAELGSYQPVRPDFMGLLGQSLSHVTHNLESAVEIVPPAAAPDALPRKHKATHTVNKWRPALNALLFFAAVFALFKAPIF